jgi:protein-S-isoprenylcysteine O-methyltransferase Ste14
MEKKRYESPLFTVLPFLIFGLGIAVSVVDPTGIAGSHGTEINSGTLLSQNFDLVVVGLLMLISGIVIRLVAITTLKKNFSGRLRLRDDHYLVKTGIYQYIRHPAYLGAILLFLSFPIILSSILGFLIMLTLVPYFLHRITLEERMLIERFGAEYEEYRKHSKRLIPLLY